MVAADNSFYEDIPNNKCLIAKDSFRAHHLDKPDFSFRSIFHAEQAIIFISFNAQSSSNTIQKIYYLK